MHRQVTTLTWVMVLPCGLIACGESIDSAADASVRTNADYLTFGDSDYWAFWLGKNVRELYARGEIPRPDSPHAYSIVRVHADYVFEFAARLDRGDPDRSYTLGLCRSGHRFNITEHYYPLHAERIGGARERVIHPGEPFGIVEGRPHERATGHMGLFRYPDGEIGVGYHTSLGRKEESGYFGAYYGTSFGGPPDPLPEDPDVETCTFAAHAPPPQAPPPSSSTQCPPGYAHRCK
jgi:hypothetical protein